MSRKKLSAAVIGGLVERVERGIEAGDTQLPARELARWRRDRDGQVAREVLIRQRDRRLGELRDQLRVRVEMLRLLADVRPLLARLLACSVDLETTAIPDPTDPHAMALRRRHDAMHRPGPVAPLPDALGLSPIGIEPIERLQLAIDEAIRAIPDDALDEMGLARLAHEAGLSKDAVSLGLGYSQSWMRMRDSVGRRNGTQPEQIPSRNGR